MQPVIPCTSPRLTAPALKRRLFVQSQHVQQCRGRPDGNILAFFIELFGTFFLGGLFRPFTDYQHGGFLGDVFAYLAAAFCDIGPQPAFIIGLELAGERDVLAKKWVVGIGIVVGFRHRIWGGHGLPWGGLAPAGVASFLS